jgi:hypothetical protein
MTFNFKTDLSMSLHIVIIADQQAWQFARSGVCLTELFTILSNLFIKSNKNKILINPI